MAQLEFDYALGPAAGWGDFERRTASIGVLSYLLEPRDAKRRRRIRNGLLAADLEKLTGESRGRTETAQALAAITAGLDLPSLAKTLSSKSYLKALAFDLDKKGKRGTVARGIVSVGLIVKIMHDAAGQGTEQNFGPKRARERITEKYKRNGLFDRNESDLNNAWMRNRPIAHLSAALVEFISDRQLRRFRTAERAVWRRDIVEYLECANYFKHYLHQLQWQPKLRFKYDLLELPVEWSVGRREPKAGVEALERLIARPAKTQPGGKISHFASVPNAKPSAEI